MRKIISYLVQLFQKRFIHLGNLYKIGDFQQLHSATTAGAVVLGCEYSSSEDVFCLGKVVDQLSFWGDNPKFEVHREPFESSQDWLCTSLRLRLLAADNPVTVIDNSYDDSDLDDSDHEPSPCHTPEATKVRAQRLMSLLPTLFPTDETEVFVLHHHDLHANNIFVRNDHELSGIID